MKNLIIIIALFYNSIGLKAQSVYFYTNSTDLIQNVGVKIIYNDEQLTKIKENSWIKFDFPNVSQATFKFKSGTYFSNKSITINFTNKDVVFISINLEHMSWSVYEQTYPDVPSIVWNDYAINKNNLIKNNRISNHPITNWSESKIKERLNKNYEPLEGIYENSFTSSKMPRYKISVLKDNGHYNIIYLSGGDREFWKEGDVKAYLTETATPFLFKAKWYMSDKSLNDEVFLKFENGSFTTIFGDGSENLYIKLFPVSTEVEGDNFISSGTGFGISPNGYIVTNYHVVENGKNIKIKGINGDFSKEYIAFSIAVDKNNDIAILKINDPKFEKINNIPYKLTLKILDVGTSVYALGYPLRSTMGDEVKLTNGIISSKSGFQGDITTYQISVPVQPGNSGGPLIDNKGNIVGIINAKHSDAENASYAIKTIYLYNLLQSLETPPGELSNNYLENKSLTEQVKTIKNFVYIVEVK
jgi:S1-C subfamily serine protease